ncbi:MAG: DUF1573 domain-containing protein [Planctomycetota bacterium]
MTWTRGGVGLFLVAALAAAAAAGPDRRPGDLVFDRETLDLGARRQQEEVTARVTVTNRGTQPLTRLRAIADCGCYEATLGAERLEPGQQTELVIRFRTLTFTGRFAKRVKVLYDDPDPAQSELRIEVAVVAGVVLKPGRLHLGNVRLGERPTGEVAVCWYEGEGEPFEVRGLVVPEARVEVETAPYQDARDPKWRGVTLKVRFLDTLPRGPHAFDGVVTTSSPTQAEVRLPITAVGVGRLWLPSNRMSVGVIARGTARTATMPLKVLERGLVPGRLEAVVPSGRLLAVIETAAPEGWALAVTVPADAAPGPIDEIVEVRTDVEGEERLAVRVLGHVTR